MSSIIKKYNSAGRGGREILSLHLPTHILYYWALYNPNIYTKVGM
jgi:hypothetical protein